MSAPIWMFVNGVPQFNGALTITGDFTTTAGTVSAASLVSTGNVRAAQASVIFWNSSTRLTAGPAGVNGQFNITNQADTAGIGFDVTTDAVMKVRTRAQSAYATLDVLGLQASGVPGATGTFANVTVVNGIVTSGT